MWIRVDMVDSGGVECARTPDNPMHFISLREEVLRKVRAVLTSNPRNQRFTLRK